MFFFFKQKTAYEMRISDWSSDVCSSDLRRHEYRWSGDRPWLVIPARPRMTPTHAPIESINDFVVKFANVNGSGSASANELFAKAILRMGVPVSPRNIFPSNIQGLPTWYEVRVSERGWLGRRGGVDLMVALNPQT